MPDTQPASLSANPSNVRALDPSAEAVEEAALLSGLGAVPMPDGTTQTEGTFMGDAPSTPAPTSAPVENTPPILDAPAPQAPAIQPPVVSAPPAPPAAEPAPVPAPVETAPDVKVPTWRQIREAEKRTKETANELQAEREARAALERERAELQAQLRTAQTPPEERIEPDPLTTVEQRLARAEQMLQATQIENRLNQQATEFARQHPDYQQALQHYIDTQRKEAELTGELDEVASRIRQLKPAEVRQEAFQRGVSEADMSRELAYGVLFEARRQALMVGAQRQGRTVPEVVYELAQARGFHTGNGTETAAPALPASASAAEQVRREQTQAAEASLSSLSTSGSAPPKGITTRIDFMSMEASEQMKYVDEMDQRARLKRDDPNWVPEDWHTRLR